MGSSVIQIPIQVSHHTALYNRKVPSRAIVGPRAEIKIGFVAPRHYCQGVGQPSKAKVWARPAFESPRVPGWRQSLPPELHWNTNLAYWQDLGPDWTSIIPSATARWPDQEATRGSPEGLIPRGAMRPTGTTQTDFCSHRRYPTKRGTAQPKSWK